jgi:hypothetical protein
MSDLRPAQDISPASAPARSRFSWLVFIASSMMMVCAAGVLMVYVPKFKQIFSDFKLQLPTVTQFLLEISDAASGWGSLTFVVIPIALGFLAPHLWRGTTALDPQRAARTLHRWVALLVVLCFTLGLILFTTIAVMMPMISLIEGISNNNGTRAR